MKSTSFLDFAQRVCRVRLTPGQRVLAAVAFDGIEPGSFEGDERALARGLFGDVDDVPDGCRHVVSIVAGRAASKSYLGALVLLWRALTADVSSLAPGQVGVALVVAPRLKLAKEVIRYARGAARLIPQVRIADDTSEGFVIAREGGRAVAIEALPASQGGAAVRGRSIVEALLDESAFFRDADFAINDADVFAAIAPRVLPGGQIIVASSPWTEGGLLFDLHEQNFGRPTTGLAAHAPTLLLRNDERTRAMVDRERLRDPENAAREFDAEFLGGGAGIFFDQHALATASGGYVLPQSREPSETCFAAADFAFRSDSSALAIVGRRGDLYRLVALEEMRPKKGSPLKPSEVCARFAVVAREYGCTVVRTDFHYIESVREHLTAAKLHVVAAPGGQDGKAQTYLTTRTLLNESRLSLPAHPRLLRQLRDVVSKPMPGGGLAISSPRRAGGGHGDMVSAVVLAAFAAERSSRPTGATKFPTIHESFDLENNPIGFY